jgi:hypothetical protein
LCFPDYGGIPPVGKMENTDDQQETNEQKKSRMRRTREAVRSDEYLEEDAEFSRAWQEGAFSKELGEEVAHLHAMKVPEGCRAATLRRYKQIALSLAEVRPCFPREWKYREIEDGLGPVEVSLCFPPEWERDQLKISQEQKLSFAGNGGVIPEEKRPQIKARYFKKSAIEAGSLRERRRGAWRRLLHPKVGVFRRNEKTEKMKMTPKGVKWLEKIARAEAMRWSSGNERMGMPVKSTSAHLDPGEEVEPRRLKPKILTEELVHDLAFEWLRDARALVRFLQALLACYDNLSKPESFYPHKVTTAQAMSEGSLKTQDDNWRLSRRIDALCASEVRVTQKHLNKFKEEIRKKGRAAVKRRTSPSG